MNDEKVEKLCSLDKKRTILRKVLSVEVDDAGAQIKTVEIQLLKHEDQFVKDWQQFTKTPKLGLEEFLSICENLVEVITKERQSHKNFRKLLKHDLDELRELNDEIDLLKNQLSKSKGDDRK